MRAALSASTHSIAASLLISCALTGSTTARAEECAQDSDARLIHAAKALETAYEQVRPKDLDRAGAELRKSLPCTRQPLSIDTAIAVHRAEALYRFTLYDRDGSTRAWLAVRALEPSYDPPEHWIPDDHPIQELWDHPPQPWTQRLTSSPPGGWRVDGVLTDQVPTTRAFVLQAIDRRGTIMYSGYLLSQTEVPTADWRARRRRNARIWGTTIAGVGGVGASVLTAAGLRYRRVAIDPRTNDADLRRLQQRANTSFGGAMALTAASISTGVLAWSVRW
ncbi:MAG: hypothetical protein ACI9MC_001086 [Kiritimatiellia bacterium]|jgi:hypothetical protein